MATETMPKECPVSVCRNRSSLSSKFHTLTTSSSPPVTMMSCGGPRGSSLGGCSPSGTAGFPSGTPARFVNFPQSQDQILTSWALSSLHANRNWKGVHFSTACSHQHLVLTIIRRDNRGNTNQNKRRRFKVCVRERKRRLYSLTALRKVGPQKNINPVAMVAPVQDLPPPGGYQSIPWKRMPPKSYFKCKCSWGMAI